MLSMSLLATTLKSTEAPGILASRLRPPSVPLVLHDPFFSIWSPADRLTDATTVHWTGGQLPLTGIVSIDGKPFRFMGQNPSSIPALNQVDLQVLPTRTLYKFSQNGVEVNVAFVTPALPDQLEVLSRPLTYVVLEAKSTDGSKHNVDFSFDASGMIATDNGDQQVSQSQSNVGPLSVLKIGRTSQPVLARRGDAVRIDWGYLYASSPQDQLDKSGITVARSSADWPASAPQTGTASNASASLKFKTLEVGNRPASRWLMLAYDDEYSIQYFKQNLRPYWRRNGDNATKMIAKAATDFPSLRKKCEKFDAELMADLEKAGGKKYAELCALSYRQTLAGCKLVADPKGQPLLFPKENTSNGCIATVDIIYPMAPQFLLFGSSLSRAMLVPVLDYSASSRWKFPFAPHDLGTYPQANGQVYGGGERTEENQMPVEESANMLIVIAALAEVEGNADFAAKYWPTLTKWADYLKEKGFDPENQLCTDDFLGHLAHNVNLSAKAMIGIASYARLCELKGDKAKAKEYGDLAKSFADRWVKEAQDGDHTRLAFDKPKTWSQKYNIVWDKILGLNLFSDEVRRQEVAFYRKAMNPFGVPLDNRSSGAKLDWSLWTATLTQNPSDFAAIMEPVYRFANETPQRIGLGDWYDTANGNHNFMHSRPVVGGVFLQLLYSDAVWKKWSSRDTNKADGWAPIPKPPVVTPVVAAADTAPATWKYTTSEPVSGWNQFSFDDSQWLSGQSGFGTSGTPGAAVHTDWSSSDIWLRREIQLSGVDLSKLELWLHHDEDIEVYINGVLAFSASGWVSQYDVFPMSKEARKALKAGLNTVAIHCHQTSGGQYVDMGFVTVKK